MQIEIDLLGGFEVRVQGQPVPALAWKLRHPRQLLQILALQPGFRLSRDQVCEQLWPHADAAAASNRLHHTTHLLRALFVRTGVPAAQPIVTTQASALQLNTDHDFRVDVARFSATLKQVRKCREPEQTEGLLQSATELYRGELLCGSPQEDWLSSAREQCRLEMVWALDRLAIARRMAGDTEHAVALLQALVNIDVTNETAHRTLMELYESTGHPDRAVFQYGACRRALQRDLDVVPSPETQRVLDRIVARDHARNAPVREVVRVKPQRTLYVVPPRAIALVGRDDDLGILREWIVCQAARWVTITGSAGMGKTRLAQELVSNCQDHFSDGVAVVSLTELSGDADLADHLAVLLCTGSSAGDTSTDRLRHHLRDRHMLLLLDRFEHVLDAGTLIADLLAACPKLVVLVTSQVALHHRTERVYPLPSLVARGTQYATDLFCQVAEGRGVLIDQPEDLAVVDIICARLDGNALAIELAAGQSQIFNTAQILHELDHPLELLKNPSRDAEAPHRSLKHAIAWSFALLPEVTQEVLCAVSVFPALFSADDAVQVLAPLFSEESLRAGLQLLAERNLVCYVPNTDADSPRAGYLLLDSVGQFARERLAALACAHQVQSRHATFFADLARELAVELGEMRSIPAVKALRRYQADVLVALKWQEQHGEPEKHCQLAIDCAGFAILAGQAESAIKILRSAIRSISNATTEQRVMLAWCSYKLARAHGWDTDRSEALRAIRAARLLAKGCNDALLQDKIMMHLAVERTHQMRYRPALFHLNRLIERHRLSGDSRRLATEYGVLAGIQNLMGRPRAAVLSSRLALEHAVCTGLPQLLGFALVKLTETCSRAGDTRSAQHYLAKCRQLPANAFSVLRWMYLDNLHTVVAFECLDFDAGRAALHTALERSQSAGRASWKLVIQIMFDFIAIEADQSDEVKVLPDADLRHLAHNAQLTELTVRLYFYRIRYFSARGQGSLALIALRHVAELLARSPNAIWRSLLYEACCFALLAGRHRYGCQVLLSHARKSLAAADADPSLRQTRNWTRIETGLDAEPRGPCANRSLAPTAWQVSDACALPQLLQFMHDCLMDTTVPDAMPPQLICAA